MESNVSVKNIVGIVLVFVLIIVLIGILFYVNISKEKITSIKGTVNYIGNDYILVTSNDGLEYKLSTGNSFDVGDVIIVSIKDLNQKKKPLEATIMEITYLSKSASLFSDNVDTLMAYFTNLNYDLDNYNNEDDEKLLSIKEGFINMVDFLFYNKELKGITFKDLTDDIKIHVLKLAYQLDSKIEEKLPGYKEEISRTSSKIYSDVKNRIVVSYFDIASRVCTNNEDICMSAKEGLRDLRDNYSLTWGFIKSLSSISSSKIKSWYEIWKEI